MSVRRLYGLRFEGTHCADRAVAAMDMSTAAPINAKREGIGPSLWLR